MSFLGSGLAPIRVVLDVLVVAGSIRSPTTGSWA